MQTIFEGSRKDGALTQWVSVEVEDDEVTIFTATDSDYEVGKIDSVSVPLPLAKRIAAALVGVQ